jgi:hypothetical protein
MKHAGDVGRTGAEAARPERLRGQPEPRLQAACRDSRQFHKAAAESRRLLDSQPLLCIGHLETPFSLHSPSAPIPSLQQLQSAELFCFITALHSRPLPSRLLNVDVMTAACTVSHSASQRAAGQSRFHCCHRQAPLLLLLLLLLVQLLSRVDAQFTQGAFTFFGAGNNQYDFTHCLSGDGSGSIFVTGSTDGQTRSGAAEQATHPRCAACTQPARSCC